MSTYKLVCPHCSSKVRIRTSEGTHIFLRVAYRQCVNEACGWSVRAQFEMTHEMSPCGMQNPAVRLLLAAQGETFMLNTMPIWVRPVAVGLSVAQREIAA